MEHLRIGIVGNIGVGKSTLVKAASSKPLNKILLEIVKLNKTNDYVDPLTIKKTLSNKSILKTLNMPSIEKFINIFNTISTCHSICIFRIY